MAFSLASPLTCLYLKSNATLVFNSISPRGKPFGCSIPGGSRREAHALLSSVCNATWDWKALSVNRNGCSFHRHSWEWPVETNGSIYTFMTAMCRVRLKKSDSENLCPILYLVSWPWPYQSCQRETIQKVRMSHWPCKCSFLTKYTHICVCVYVSVCIYMYTHIYTYICIHVCIYVCMYICICDIYI